jgi:hypothetical protein
MSLTIDHGQMTFNDGVSEKSKIADYADPKFNVTTAVNIGTGSSTKMSATKGLFNESATGRTVEGLPAYFEKNF